MLFCPNYRGFFTLFLHPQNFFLFLFLHKILFYFYLCSRIKNFVLFQCKSNENLNENEPQTCTSSEYRRMFGEFKMRDVKKRRWEKNWNLGYIKIETAIVSQPAFAFSSYVYDCESEIELYVVWELFGIHILIFSFFSVDDGRLRRSHSFLITIFFNHFHNHHSATHMNKTFFIILFPPENF